MSGPLMMRGTNDHTVTTPLYCDRMIIFKIFVIMDIIMYYYDLNRNIIIINYKHDNIDIIIY